MEDEAVQGKRFTLDHVDFPLPFLAYGTAHLTLLRHAV
jgi:hypothetical protein